MSKRFPENTRDFRRNVRVGIETRHKQIKEAQKPCAWWSAWNASVRWWKPFAKLQFKSHKNIPAVFFFLVENVNKKPRALFSLAKARRRREEMKKKRKKKVWAVFVISLGESARDPRCDELMRLRIIRAKKRNRRRRVENVKRRRAESRSGFACVLIYHRDLSVHLLLGPFSQLVYQTWSHAATNIAYKQEVHDEWLLARRKPQHTDVDVERITAPSCMSWHFTCKSEWKQKTR